MTMQPNLGERPRFLPQKPLKALQVAESDLVRESFLDEEARFLLVLEAKGPAVDLARWAESHRSQLLARLREHGGLLFRGFTVGSPDEFAAVARAISPELLDYLERAAARTQVAPRVFTSTELAADQWIPHHHEMSYSHNWPAKIFFYCDVPASEGGRTPVASERKFFPRLDPAIKARFLERRVMYVRNYGEHLDLPWREAFQTEDRAEVEAYCRRWGTEFEWLDGDCLRTRQVRQAVVDHPGTGETVWFNHAHLFHESNLQPEIRESLLASFGSEGLPRNAYYGDGSRIEDSVLSEIRGTYQECSVSFPWQQGDVLLLDNFLTTHGREPYRGSRRILVAMAELFVNEAARS